MKKTLKHLLIGTTLGVMALGAIATEGKSSPDDKPRHAHQSSTGHHKKMDPAKFQEKVAKRQADLREKLNLSAAQEPAWNAYIASVTPPARDKAQMAERAKQEKLNAPQRMERSLQHLKQAEAHMTKRLDALKTFYAQLTPQQQATFDEQSQRRHHKRGHHHQRG